MQWNTVWNERCPVCGGAVPAGMPPLEVRATQAEYLHFRVCSPGCAAAGVRRPTQHFMIAERNQAARTPTPVAGAVLAQAIAPSTATRPLARAARSYTLLE